MLAQIRSPPWEDTLKLRLGVPPGDAVDSREAQIAKLGTAR